MEHTRDRDVAVDVVTTIAAAIASTRFGNVGELSLGKFRLTTAPSRARKSAWEAFANEYPFENDAWR